MAITNLIDTTARAEDGHLKFRITTEDLVGMGDNLDGDIFLMTIPAGSIVKNTLVATTEAVTGVTTAVGYLRTTSPAVDFGTTTYNLKTAVGSTNFDLYSTPKYFPAAADLYFHAIVTVEHLDDTTAGEVIAMLDIASGYTKS